MPTALTWSSGNMLLRIASAVFLDSIFKQEDPGMPPCTRDAGREPPGWLCALRVDRQGMHRLRLNRPASL